MVCPIEFKLDREMDHHHSYSVRSRARFREFVLGMGRYEKYVDRDVANAKPYRIRDSAF